MENQRFLQYFPCATINGNKPNTIKRNLLIGKFIRRFSRCLNIKDVILFHFFLIKIPLYIVFLSIISTFTLLLTKFSGEVPCFPLFFSWSINWQPLYYIELLDGIHDFFSPLSEWNLSIDFSPYTFTISWIQQLHIFSVCTNLLSLSIDFSFYLSFYSQTLKWMFPK